MVSDGAKLIAAAKQTSTDTYVIDNDGVTYTVTPTALSVTSNSNTFRTETWTDYGPVTGHADDGQTVHVDDGQPVHVSRGAVDVSRADRRSFGAQESGRTEFGCACRLRSRRKWAGPRQRADPWGVRGPPHHAARLTTAATLAGCFPFCC